MIGLASMALVWNGDLLPLWGLREPVSALTHLLGALLSIAGGVLLWRRASGDRPKQISLAIYAAALVALYFASAAYHMVSGPPGRVAWFRRADHAAIFLLIAGTFTPFYFNAARGWWRIGVLSVVWVMAAAGIALKIAWIDMPDGPSAGLYVGMGWLGLIGYGRLAAALTHGAMAFTALGGVIYTAGAAADVFEWPVPLPGFFGFHETFHVMVMVASAVHFLVVLRYVVPLASQGTGPRAAAYAPVPALA